MAGGKREGAGRPKAEIDAAKVENAAGIGCTVEEIAAVLGVGVSTLKDRVAAEPELAEALERGRDKGKATLRRLQWQAANGGNPTMLIWLGKQMLGQKDRVEQEHTGKDGGPLVIQWLPSEP
jgi:hypothetical protein